MAGPSRCPTVHTASVALATERHILATHSSHKAIVVQPRPRPRTAMTAHCARVSLYWAVLGCAGLYWASIQLHCSVGFNCGDDRTVELYTVQRSAGQVTRPDRQTGEFRTRFPAVPQKAQQGFHRPRDGRRGGRGDSVTRIVGLQLTAIPTNTSDLATVCPKTITETVKR